MIKNRTS